MNVQIPKWSGLTKSDLTKIDLGARLKPITRSEGESGILLRGPVVLSATPRTPDLAKRRLPVIMTNVRLIKTNSRFFVEYTGSPYALTEFEIKPIIRPTTNGLLITTVDGTQAKLRKILRGDLQMFRFGPGSSQTEVQPFLELFWGIQ